MQVTILGNASGGPFHGRHYTAQVLKVDNQVFILDCGEGTQMQVYRFRLKIDRCRQIFISHLHGDHVFGLMGLLTNWSLKKRSEALDIFSPPGLQELVETTLRLCAVRMSYPLRFHAVDAGRSAKVYENSKVEVWSIPLDHRSPTTGWLFREKPKPRKLIQEKIEAYAIPYALLPGIKAGQDLLLPNGHRVPNADLSTAPPPPRSYAFCSDTAPSDQVAALVQGVDLLYHEATFTAAHLAEAAISYHSTAAQAAEIARRAGAKRLLLGHFSGRYADEQQHLAEATAIFADTETAVEGKMYAV
jgi:ribonuclease Z